MARNSRQARTRARTRHHGGTQAQRLLPWVLLSQATDIVRDHPMDLAPEDRGRLRELVARSGGRGINLSPRERNEVALIVARAERTRPARALPVPRVASRAAGRRTAR